MKNILHLRSSGGVLGAENVIIELSRFSGRNGFHSIVGAIHHTKDPAPQFIRLATNKGIETKLFSATRRFDGKCMRSIRRFIKERKIDLIHCHGYKEDIYGYFAGMGYPRVATNHLWKKSDLRSKAYTVLDSLMLHRFTSVIGVSEEIVEEMRCKGIKNTLKIANGVDCSLFAPRQKSTKILKELNLTNKDTVVCMVSSLSPVKAHSIAIHAFTKLIKDFPNAKLCIAGEGKAEPDIRRLIEEYKLSQATILTGALEDIPEFLSVADIFLLPSLKEGLPMALLEAMAAQKPPIASAVGEIPNVIDNGISGILVEPANADQITDSLRFLLNNPQRAMTIGREARSRIVRDFSSEAMADSYCAVYEEILAKEAGKMRMRTMQKAYKKA